MPVARNASLSPHFLAWELGGDRPEATAEVVANLGTTARGLESIRQTLGVPLLVNHGNLMNRGFRPPTVNAGIVGASDTSDHIRGLAADFNPVGYGGSLRDVYDTLDDARRAGRLAPFDQIIFYPVTGHIHVGYGPRMRGEMRIALAEGGYPLITSATLDALGASVLGFGRDVAGFALSNPALVLGVVALLILAIVL